MNKNVIRTGVLIGSFVTGTVAWHGACKNCDSINEYDSEVTAIRKATNSVIWGMLYCCSIKTILDFIK